MTSFKFPPPPPPPPRASSNDIQPSYPSQRGGRGGRVRGRGDGSHGGGGSNRGGNNNFGGNPRGGQGYAHGGRGSSHSRGPREGHENNRGGDPGRGGSYLNHGQQQQYTPSIHVAPTSTNAYTNPPIATPIHNGGSAQGHVDPNAFAQAMAFMATPAGAQSMAVFASHVARAGNPPYAQVPHPQQAQQAPQYPPIQQLGQKRKWDERRNNGHTQSHPQLQHRPQQQGHKPPRAKAALPPPVPTFGFSLPKPPPAPASVSSKANKAKNSRKGRVKLGLTQVASSEESGEDEDVDEEVVLGSKLKGGGFAFEHEGESISLQTAGDIVEWIKDRRRNFPTLKKAQEKAEAAAIKRRNELEFVRKLKGKPRRAEMPPREEPTSTAHQPSKRDQKRYEELAALRKKLHESMQKKQVAPAAIDLGLGYGSETGSDDDSSSVLSESSVVSSSEESPDDSEVDSDDKEAAPEAISSKAAPLPIKIPPPPAGSHMPPKPDKERTCQNFKNYGTCSYGHSCKFKHPKKETKRAGLYEKLVEQELLKSDQLALDAIKFLGQNGFLG